MQRKLACYCLRVAAGWHWELLTAAKYEQEEVVGQALVDFGGTLFLLPLFLEDSCEVGICVMLYFCGSKNCYFIGACGKYEQQKFLGQALAFA